MKRTSINKYLNILYKYYCEKSDFEYKPLINKNDTKLNDNILETIDKIYNKYSLRENSNNCGTIHDYKKLNI